MTNPRSPYRIGAFFVVLSAVLHLIAPVVSGFDATGWQLAVIGVIYVAAAAGLMRDWRWLAYVMLFVMMIGSIAAITGIWALAAVPGWVYGAITIANWAAVIALFLALWRPAQKEAAPV